MGGEADPEPGFFEAGHSVPLSRMLYTSPPHIRGRLGRRREAVCDLYHGGRPRGAHNP